MTARTPVGDGEYLLTGATGFLGSHLMAGLLLQGKNLVIAGRASGTESLEARVRKLLAWFGIGHLQERVTCHETDFQKTRMGLAEDEYEALCRRGLSIIHCASDTSFTERERAKVMTSNVESLTALMDFASRSKTRCFHLLSSAYAAGLDRAECPEAPAASRVFTNVYEESKAKAEQIVAGRCREAGVPYTILRPSIVYGSAASGKALKFNALYYPVRSLLLIRDIYLEDIRHHGGRKAAECGMYMHGDGMLHLPIRITVPHEGNINLVPVDYFTDAVLSILEDPVPGTYYHITGTTPERMSRLASYTERFLGITGIEIVDGTRAAAPNGARNPAEEIFDHFIKAYRPYMADTRVFRRENTDRATGGALPKELSYEIFERCMSYAVSVDWGKTLFS